VTRDVFGAGEQIAHDIVRRQAEVLGCEVSVDDVGNLWLAFAGRDRTAPAIVIGSHLDSVPHGGNFDGAAGVIAGLAVIAELKARGIRPDRDIRVVAFRAEEAAWFGLSYPGSYAALGRLDPGVLAATRTDTGRTLEDHMISAGFSPDAIRHQRPQVDAGSIDCFVEVHIEQGPVLVPAELPVGIVTAINGGFRHAKARVSGAWDHSGAAPRHHRRDALLGFNGIVNDMQEAWDAVDAAGQSATITFGKVMTDPALHGGSRVAGSLDFSIDVRSQFADSLTELEAALLASCRRVEAEFDVSVDLGEQLTWPIAVMNKDLVDALAAASHEAGVASMRMPSGAGHDAAVFAEAGIPTAMLFVRNENGSHNPHEAMDVGDLDQAVKVLAAFITGRGL
jgi:N-carbamoyl-L-amino-acid hydrolase